MIEPKSTLEGYFERGDAPTQNQFTNLIDSLRHEENEGKLTISVSAPLGIPTDGDEWIVYEPTI